MILPFMANAQTTKIIAHRGAWKEFNLNQVLADKSLWGEDLSALPGFEAAVQKYI